MAFSFSRSSSRRVFRPWAVWLGLLLPLGLSWLLLWLQRQQQLDRAQTIATAESQTLIQNLEKRIARYRYLAVDLASEGSVRQALMDPKGPSLGVVRQELFLLAKASGVTLDQVRLIDARGVELIWWGYDDQRDEFHERKPTGVLSTKAFFLAGLATPPGQSWVSPTEIFRSNERLGMSLHDPVEPYLRIVAPVHLAAASLNPKPIGLVVLSVRVEGSSFAGPVSGRPWLVMREDGSFIYRQVSSSATNATIPMAPDGTRLMTFTERFGLPLSGLKKSGTLRTPEGLLSYQQVPLDKNRSWYVVQSIPMRDILHLDPATFLELAILWGLSLGLIFVLWRGLDRAQSAHQRETQAQLLRAILSASSDLAIIVTDSGGIIRMFSAGAEQMLGRRSSEIVGRMSPLPFHEPVELRTRVEELLGTRGRPVTPFEVLVSLPNPQRWTYLHTDGSHFPVGLAMIPLRRELGSRNPRGGLFGYLIVVQNIQLQVEREAALESSVREANNVAQLKSNFLATMSHEVRTPMNAIVAMTRFLKTTKLDSDQQDITEVGERAARNLLEMLDTILDFSKLEAGKSELASSPFSPAAITRECCEIARIQAKEKGLDFQVNLPLEAPVVLGDAVRLRQILNNLLGNAVKFTHQGNIRVDLAITTEGRRQFMRWEIRDTGIGLSPDDQSRIFLPFTQASGDPARGYGGTGLGLSLCQELVARMGGTITVTSAPGQGSCFGVAISFPMVG